MLCIAEKTDPTMREIAECVGITERATQRIIRELCERGYVSRVRRGRRNAYTVHAEQSIDEPSMRDRRLGELLGAVSQTSAPSERYGTLAPVGSGGARPKRRVSRSPATVAI